MTTTALVFVLTLSLVGLIACSHSPSYQKPQPAEKQTWAAAPTPESAIAGPDVIHPEWWKGFHDDTLNALIAQASEANLDYANQLLNVHIASVNRGSPADLLAPLSIGKTRQLNRRTGAPEPVAIQWEVDLLSGIQKNQHQNRKDEALYFKTEAEKRAYYLALVSNIGNRYFLLRSLDDRLAYLDSELANIQKLITIAEYQYREGLIDKLSLERRKAQVSQQLERRLSIQSLRDTEELEISLLLGEVPGTFKIPAGRAIDSIKPIPVPGVLPAQVVQKRPDIVAAEQAMRVAFEDRELSHLNTLPSLRVSLDGTLLTNPLKLVTQAVGSLLVTPLDQSKKRAHQSSQLQQQQSVNTWRQTVLNAYKEIEQAFLRRQSVQEQGVLLQQRLERLENILAAQRSKQKAGLISAFELISDENQAIAARLSLNENHLNLLQASLDIYKSLGGGWPTQANAAYE